MLTKGYLFAASVATFGYQRVKVRALWRGMDPRHVG